MLSVKKEEPVVGAPTDGILKHGHHNHNHNNQNNQNQSNDQNQNNNQNNQNNQGQQRQQWQIGSNPNSVRRLIGGDAMNGDVVKPCSSMTTESVDGDALVVLDNHAPVWTLRDFDVGRKLGEGQFGAVYLARERRSGFLVALKAIKKSQLLSTFNDHLLRREIDIHSHLLHPNILQFYAWFTTKTRIYLILEIAPNGELMEQLENGGLPEALVSKYMKQMISAIRCCHRLNIMHRDLKPENILLDMDGNVKLADFGWASHLPTADNKAKAAAANQNENVQNPATTTFSYLRKRRKTFCGTLDYLSPEICRHEWYGPEVDVWCLGVLCYELATGGPPFSHEKYQTAGLTEQESRKCQQRDIQSCDINRRLKSSMSHELKDFLSKSLIKEPSDRPSTKDLLKHAFIRKYNSLDDELDLDDPEPPSVGRRVTQNFGSPWGADPNSVSRGGSTRLPTIQEG